jgi:hypothetical protein
MSRGRRRGYELGSSQGPIRVLRSEEVVRLERDAAHQEKILERQTQSRGTHPLPRHVNFGA